MDAGAPKSLHPLRQDLRLLRSAPMLSGEHSWLIYDPLQHRYFQIGREAFELLSLWQAAPAEQLRAMAQARMGHPLSADDISAMETFLDRNGLLDKKGPGAAQEFYARSEGNGSGWLTRLSRNYLFFRVPLVRPDAFLQSTLAFVAPLFTRTAVFFIALLGVVGLYLVSRQWDAFVSTFLHFFSLQGLVLFGLSLAFVKTVHELAHGYMAARFRVRVPVMGVAFLLLFPMLYTDVSDAWRLKSRREKLLIDAAGILAELMLAAIATFLWVFLPDGGARSAAFFIATTSWTLSLLINLNPLMRFDGYFILTDILNIPNLQARSFALGKWWLREILFGLGVAPPENIPHRQAIKLALYAWAVWVYRLLLFLGIALIVYHATFKVLGVILFVLEIVWLIAIPIFVELKVWWTLRRNIMSNMRSLGLPIFLIALVGLLAMPLDRHVSVDALLQGEEQAQIFAPFPAQISTISATPGQKVNKGDVLFKLSSSEKNHALEQSIRRRTTIEQRLARIVSDQTDLSESLVLESQLEQEKQLATGLMKEIDSLVIRAPFDATVEDFDKELRPGLWLSDNTPLATLVSRDGTRVSGLVVEDDLSRLSVGADGLFVPDDPMRDSTQVKVADIARVAVAKIEEPYFASVFDGPIAVEKDEKDQLRPVSGYYKVTFKGPSSADVGQIVRGSVVVDAKSASYGEDIVRSVLKVIVRESGV